MNLSQNLEQFMFDLETSDLLNSYGRSHNDIRNELSTLGFNNNVLSLMLENRRLLKSVLLRLNLYSENNLSEDTIRQNLMKLNNNSMDLIIIMGSIEHVVDLNLVMRKCEKAIKKGGILVLESRGDPLGNTKGFFNQSHHRYFFENTLELIMIKYGWEPFLTTKYPITGPTRENTIFCLGKYKGKKVSNNFQDLVKHGKKETFEDIKYKLMYHDYLAKRSPGKLLLR